MNRVQWRSEHRSARLGRRRDGAACLGSAAADERIAPARLMRRRAVWAVVGVAVMAGALAFWRVQPGEQRGEALAVSVPAASSPAADEVPSIRS